MAATPRRGEGRLKQPGKKTETLIKGKGTSKT